MKRRRAGYAYWGRHAYESFYYFSTPLRRWWKFKGLIRWPRMPRPVEHRILRALDVYLHYLRYVDPRHRRRRLTYLRLLRRARTEPLDQRKANTGTLGEAIAENLCSIGTPTDKAQQRELERHRQARGHRMAVREIPERATMEESAETERMLLEWLRNKPHAPTTEAERQKAVRDLLDVIKGPPTGVPEDGAKPMSRLSTLVERKQEH